MPKRRRRTQHQEQAKSPGALSNTIIENESESPTQSSGRPHATNRWRLLYGLVPVLIALITSINSLWNYFASDDLQQVLNNAFIKQLSNLPAAFTSSVWAFNATEIVFTVDPYFRPIFTSLFTLNYALFGTAPFGWHLINVLIHAAVTLLVFLVSKEISEENRIAALTAVLFAVHPAHAESVAWVSGVTDPLMLLTLLPAFFFYLRFRKRDRKYLLAISIVFFFLALLTKETAIALPVVVAYCELLHFQTEASFRQKLVRASTLVVLYAVTIAIYIVMRYYALGTVFLSAQPRNPLLPSLLTIPLATLKYLGLMVVPWGYSYQHYTDFVESAASLSFLGPLILLVTIVIAVARAKSKRLALAAVWFSAMLAPALASLRQFEQAYMLQERYLYAPSIGICLAAALGIEWLAARSWFGLPGRLVAGCAALLLVLTWSVLLIKQNAVWDDSVSVFENAVAVSPRSAVAHAALSRSYYEAGWPRKAEAEARTALDLDSRCALAYLNLSYFARMSGKLEQACDYLEDGIAAINEGPMTRHDLATMYLNLGLMYGQRKLFEVGEEKMLKSIEISPRPVAWYYTGQFYAEQGRFEDARRMYEQTQKGVPHWFAPVHLRLGMIYEALGDNARAAEALEKYLALAPAASPDKENIRRRLSQLRGGGAPAK